MNDISMTGKVVGKNKDWYHVAAKSMQYCSCYLQTAIAMYNETRGNSYTYNCY